MNVFKKCKRENPFIRNLIALFVLTHATNFLIACTLAGTPIYQQLPQPTDPNSALEVVELVPWVEVTAHLSEDGQSVVAEVCLPEEFPVEGITPLAKIRVFDESSDHVWTLQITLVDGVTEMVIIED